MLISNVQLKSPAGYYIGTVLMEDNEPQPFSRESGYYECERDMIVDHPESLKVIY